MTSETLQRAAQGYLQRISARLPTSPLCSVPQHKVRHVVGDPASVGKVARSWRVQGFGTNGPVFPKGNLWREVKCGGPPSLITVTRCQEVQVERRGLDRTFETKGGKATSDKENVDLPFHGAGDLGRFGERRKGQRLADDRTGGRGGDMEIFLGRFAAFFIIRVVFVISSSYRAREYLPLIQMFQARFMNLRFLHTWQRIHLACPPAAP